MIGAVTAPIIFGRMHLLLISENYFFHEIKCDRITSLHGIHNHHPLQDLQHYYTSQQEGNCKSSAIWCEMEKLRATSNLPIPFSFSLQLHFINKEHHFAFTADSSLILTHSKEFGCRCNYWSGSKARSVSITPNIFLNHL